MKSFLKFPDGFLWGAATASYQVEGGIENNDWAFAAKDGRVPHAGISTDHYHRYESDFDLAKSLGHNVHRFSIEWSRIEPEEGKFNQAEIEHYRKVILALRARGIRPFVTLWHFTLPIWFSKSGGFTKTNSPEIFARYCEFVVKNLSDICSDWMTMNEPMVWLSEGYLKGVWPPFKKNIFSFLKVLGNLISAHNLAFKKIKSACPNVLVGVVKHNIYFSSDKKPWNILARFFTNWFWNYYFLQRTFFATDFIGLNYYFHSHLGKKKNLPKSDMDWDLFPEGIYHVLKSLRIYGKPIYVSEAGLADHGDKLRGEYIKNLVFWLYQSIQERVDLRGFMYWSLIDNFEWAHGYGPDFGLIYVNDKTLERIVRPSSYEYKKICENNGLEIK